MSNSKALLVTSCAATALFATFAQPAVAQAEDHPTGGEIVVTAQRRSENLQDVPISVSVVQAEQVQHLNIRTIENVQLVTPGLVFNNSYGFIRPSSAVWAPLFLPRASRWLCRPIMTARTLRAARVRYSICWT